MVMQEVLLPRTCSLLPCPWCLRDSPAGPVNTAAAAAAAAVAAAVAVAVVDASPATVARRSTTGEPATGETLAVRESPVSEICMSGESEIRITEIGDSPGGFTRPGGLPGGLVWSDVVREVLGVWCSFLRKSV